MNLARQKYLSIFGIIAVMACSPEVEVKPETQTGLWRQIGYGRILELSDSTIKVYDLNDVNCMLSFEEDILDFAEVVGVSSDTLRLRHGVDLWKCYRIQELPESCTEDVENSRFDPLFNFDVFWQNFNEHYCSFGIKNVDWATARESYRSQLTSRTSDLELYSIFKEMMTLLDDGHIKLFAPDSIMALYEASHPRERSEFGILEEFELGRMIAATYVDSLSTRNSGAVRWGLIGNDMGYLQINTMLLQADYGLPHDLGLEEFWGKYWTAASDERDEIHRKSNTQGAALSAQEVLSDLPMAKAFIIDLRFNGGGKDGAAMTHLNHFSSHQGKAASKSAFENGKQVNHQDLFIDPAANAFQHRVYMLTSHRTASAAELFVLASMCDSNFTRIGSHTEGIFSSTLDKVLPNGWSYEFSNEVYTDLNGANYEHTGIPPDIEINYSEDKDEFLSTLKSAIEEGTDEAIEMALRLEQNR